MYEVLLEKMKLQGAREERDRIIALIQKLPLVWNESGEAFVRALDVALLLEAPILNAQSKNPLPSSSS